ncbi:hypothetical protein [Cupriavidus agavae]|uniref:Uncharacterized protein n=1 Tax=Cupriavidus agavae TaxID=1001822 RepID=A0A4Q7S9J8_9BURK|nr:hypothetical protein [Cupriavidus agavae]RZT42488.1 hypothetical protein EV147_1524 [Cupriavidus agavae]
MATQQYYGHTVEGAAMFLAEGNWQASGRVAQCGAVVVQSCTIGIFRTRERAMAEGLAWGKHWIDANQCFDHALPADLPFPAEQAEQATPAP